jgi:transcriptional regulator with GAF, ATPase, and Fis domain
LPANLTESELFGHERGSFTGAMDRRIGKFELAHHSTLFLDEIGEMPLELQVKLLRALQEKEIERIGGRSTIGVDVRIIAATNRDLKKEMEEGRFRADLYYRLNIFPICLPPLRNRRDDIPLLATHFIQKLSRKIGKKITIVRKYVLEQIIHYDWPGNIRELEHVIERSLLLADDDMLEQLYLPDKRPKDMGNCPEKGFVVKTIEENERDHIISVLRHCKGRVAGSKGAATFLGIPPSTLASKLKRLGIQRMQY